LSYAFSFLLLVIPLVVFHELGHFMAAKLFGVRVNSFAFGFGKKLFGYTYKGTEYRWNLLPLGGYVDFMGEAVYTNRIPSDRDHFYNRSKWVRFIVLVMGPIFNFILAFIIFWVIAAQPVGKYRFSGDPFMVGIVDQDSPEGRAGLLSGDLITQVNGSAVRDAQHLVTELALNPGKMVELTIERQGERHIINYRVATHEKEGIGEPHFRPAIHVMVREVTPDSPAEHAGLMSGDKITHVNGDQVFWDTRGGSNMLSDAIQRAESYPIEMTVVREEQVISLFVTPQQGEDDRMIIGIMTIFDAEVVDRDWRSSFFAACDTFAYNSTTIFRFLGELVSFDLSVKTITGPVGMGKYAKQELERGLLFFAQLMAILSLNLGIINLVPIPILDGGEIFVIAVEWIARRNFEFETKMRIKMVGLVFLICLMSVVLVSDTLKIVG